MQGTVLSQSLFLFASFIPLKIAIFSKEMSVFENIAPISKKMSISRYVTHISRTTSYIFGTDLMKAKFSVKLENFMDCPSELSSALLPVYYLGLMAESGTETTAMLHDVIVRVCQTSPERSELEARHMIMALPTVSFKLASLYCGLSLI